MALSPITKLFGTKDGKIAKMLTDPPGGTATYGTSVDVPGIKSVVISGNIEEKQLRGDHSLLDSDSTLQDVTVTFNYAKLNFAAIAVMLGGVVADSGVTPNQLATWSLTGTDTLFNNFKFTAQVVSTDTPGGDAHFVLYKCKISSFPGMGTAEEDYQIFSQSASAVPRLSDNKWIDGILHETAVALT